MIYVAIGCGLVVCFLVTWLDHVYSRPPPTHPWLEELPQDKPGLLWPAILAFITAWKCLRRLGRTLASLLRLRWWWSLLWHF